MVLRCEDRDNGVGQKCGRAVREVGEDGDSVIRTAMERGGGEEVSEWDAVVGKASCDEVCVEL